MTSEIQKPRELFTCSSCGDNLATRIGDTFIVMKNIGRQHVPVELEIQNPAGSPVRLACGKCKRTSTIFVTLRQNPVLKRKGVEN